jgi:hypothetical protein
LLNNQCLMSVDCHLIWSCVLCYAMLCCAVCVCVCVLPRRPAFSCFDVQDPLLKEGTTWQCGVCSDFGYNTYLQNDPIYKNMELWTVGSTDSSNKEKPSVSSNACAKCGTSCTLLPPSGSSFPCECMT